MNDGLHSFGFRFDFLRKGMMVCDGIAQSEQTIRIIVMYSELDDELLPVLVLLGTCTNSCIAS